MFRNPSTDLIVILVIVLLIFGPKRLPGLGKSLGQGIRGFKESVTGGDEDDEAPKEQLTAGSTAASMSGEQRPADTSATEQRS